MVRVHPKAFILLLFVPNVSRSHLQQACPPLLNCSNGPYDDDDRSLMVSAHRADADGAWVAPFLTRVAHRRNMWARFRRIEERSGLPSPLHPLVDDDYDDQLMKFTIQHQNAGPWPVYDERAEPTMQHQNGACLFIGHDDDHIFTLPLATYAPVIVAHHAVDAFKRLLDDDEYCAALSQASEPSPWPPANDQNQCS